MEKKADVDESFDGFYGIYEPTRATDPKEEPKGFKKGIQPLPSSFSFDEVYDSVIYARHPQKTEDIKLLFNAVSFSKYDVFKQSPPLDMDNSEYPPQPDVRNDFIGLRTAMKDLPTQMKSQPFPTITDPKANAHVFEKIEYSLVQAFLADLIEGFSNPNFQIELQKLLMSSRKRQAPGVGRGKKAVFGRCALSQAVEEKALTNNGFPKTATVSAWKLISLFLHEVEVLAQLDEIDELLSLPPLSSFNAVRQCGELTQGPALVAGA
jgi:hypothetical protein